MEPNKEAVEFRWRLIRAAPSPQRRSRAPSARRRAVPRAGSARVPAQAACCSGLRSQHRPVTQAGGPGAPSGEPHRARDCTSRPLRHMPGTPPRALHILASGFLGRCSGLYGVRGSNPGRLCARQKPSPLCFRSGPKKKLLACSSLTLGELQLGPGSWFCSSSAARPTAGKEQTQGTCTPQGAPGSASVAPQSKGTSSEYLHFSKRV